MSAHVSCKWKQFQSILVNLFNEDEKKVDLYFSKSQIAVIFFSEDLQSV